MDQTRTTERSKPKTWYEACANVGLAIADLEDFEDMLSGDLMRNALETADSLTNQMRPGTEADLLELRTMSLMLLDWWEAHPETKPASFEKDEADK